jgi:hypothetical protein
MHPLSLERDQHLSLERDQPLSLERDQIKETYKHWLVMCKKFQNYFNIALCDSFHLSLTVLCAIGHHFFPVWRVVPPFFIPVF